ncbi:MAG: Na/Pi symporter [Pseudomonadota bacterium]
MYTKVSGFFLAFFRLLAFAALLYLFLIAIGLMGDSFKLLGQGVAEALITTTSNPFVGLMIGVLTTAIVQSSSLTTSLVVALVSGGALTVHNAVPIVMGANIGTTITCSMVSLGHIRRDEEFERAYAGATVHDIFNVLSVIVLFPLQMATGFFDKAANILATIFYGSQTASFDSPLKVIVSPVVKAIHHFLLNTMGLADQITGVLSVILSLLFIFVALTFMVKFMRQVAATKLEHWIQRIFSSNVYLIFLIGLVVTAIIQSSSITTSMIVPMLGAGLINLEQAFPIVVGANIGTTVTALIAALAGNKMGLTIAFVHLIFNVCGTLIFFVPPFMRKVPIRIVEYMVGYFIKHKKFVFIYMLLIFFIIPLLAMFISKVW